jgi:hypothetical protein
MSDDKTTPPDDEIRPNGAGEPDGDSTPAEPEGDAPQAEPT